MKREIAISAIGLWLLVLAFFGPDESKSDIALTTATGVAVLALGLWGIWNVRREVGRKLEAEMAKQVNIKAEPEFTGVTLEKGPSSGYRGFTSERDPTNFGSSEERSN